MINSTYNIDGLPLRFIKYQILDDNETVRLFTSARPYNVKFEEMPEYLRHWIPVTDEEGAQAFDHICAELGLPQPGADNPDLVAPKPSLEDEQLTKLRTMFISFMEESGGDIAEMNKTIERALMNLKDLKSGQAGTAFTEQAKQIANLLDKFIKGKIVRKDQFYLALKMFGLDKRLLEQKNSKKGPKELGPGE